ncbi:hypothetical protein B1207_03110 [Legionella quinlivanii]|uniref:Transmembrane protein n=1 Tax=Legionella quinlivanii TaxID=45073 RepID=A0A364LMA3_9GAMM|nr:hypothetical protein [Legionella quinlivanii]RAP37992.1 hypothetical protein B1207_03110 [Legionella quinlivanii]
MSKLNFSWIPLIIGASSGLFLVPLFGFAAILINVYLIAPESSNTSSLFFLLAFSYAVAMYFTGFISGRLYTSGIQKQYFGFLIGFLAWSIVLIVLIIILNNGIQYSNAHFRTISIRIVRTSLELHDGFSVSHGYISMVTLEPKASFLTFFYGALCSSLGGYLGFQKKQKKQVK